MVMFVCVVCSGMWMGYMGKWICYVINIGIGGLDFGLKMVVYVLYYVVMFEILIYFVLNVDGVDFVCVFEQVDFEEMFVIIVLKIFMMFEMMMNVCLLCDWFVVCGCFEDVFVKYFVGVLVNLVEVVKFGIVVDNVFEMWDWVGGCYLLWLVVGLLIMIVVGLEQFDELLVGVNDMDCYFCEVLFECNLLVLFGLIGIWYWNFFGLQSYFVVLYLEVLYYLLLYLQQFEMESNGKFVWLDGIFVDYLMLVVMWGELGINGQYVFFQMLYQGLMIVLIDFIVVLIFEYLFVSYYLKLFVNCFVQSEVLMFGCMFEEVCKVVGFGKEVFVLYLMFFGNCLIMMLFVDVLMLCVFGVLIVFYEYKVLVQVMVWDINLFDQWGVEFGKIFGKVVEVDLFVELVDLVKYDLLIMVLIECVCVVFKC